MRHDGTGRGKSTSQTKILSCCCWPCRVRRCPLAGSGFLLFTTLAAMH
ncbi:hypothetical protein SXCC_04549 [Gluconacetobacter sp. SXCC-1]|nr:hypothetical protein SXCC_04549 [Gluconacetobacter sp. SXCC-1]